MRLILLLLAVLGAYSQALPEPTAGGSWQDRSLFALDLRPEVVDEAVALAAAPVYHLEWRFDGPQELVARQELRVVNGSEDSWHELYFHLLPNLLGGELLIEGVRVDGEEVQPTLEEDGRLLRVDLSSPLGAQQPLVVAVDYTLSVPAAGGRNYGILAYRGEVLSLAHAYPLLAVYGGDGWDLDTPPRHGDLVHAESAFFRVAIDAPASLVIVTSGRTLSESIRGGRRLLEVAAGPVRDFYLAAGHGLEAVEVQAGEVLVRGYFAPGQSAAMTEAVGKAASALRMFEANFGAYPYRELDLVPISTSALGVEFPGIIALRRQLLDPADSDWLESTVVHEVAHQWFYSMVGNDQVSEPWLDEALVQYLTLRYFLERHGREGYQRFRESLLSRWEQVDRRTMPIGMPVESYTANEYGAIIYGLGPLVVEWLAGLIERPRFDALLREYVEQFRFGLASTSDFKELAGQYCRCDLDAFFDTWVGPVTAD